MNCLWLMVGIICFLNNVLCQYQQDVNLKLVHKWIYPEFVKNDIAERGQVTSKDLVLYDADYHPPTNRLFVTAPPFKGTPATLAEVDRQGLLKPFPTWSNGNKTDKDACQSGPPVSAYRMHIDKCGLMWVPDIGVYGTLTASQPTCPAALWVYDLNHGDGLVLRYEFPKDIITARSLPANVITESYKNDCSDTFVYIADVLDHGMIVFDYARKSSWRIEHRYFYIFPTSPPITINGVALDLNGGLCGMALSAATEPDRKLYFHSLYSVHESWVPSCVLRNETWAKDRAIARTHFHLSHGVREGPSNVQVMTDDGILIYALATSNALACWNSKTPFTRENQYVLIRDVENFPYISGLKLTNNNLVIMASRLPNFLGREELDGTVYNYRLLVVDDVQRLLQNSPCRSRFVGNSNLGYNDWNPVSSTGNTCADLQSSSQSNVNSPSPNNRRTSNYRSSNSGHRFGNLSNRPVSVRSTTEADPRNLRSGSYFYTSWSNNAQHNNNHIGFDFARRY